MARSNNSRNGAALHDALITNARIPEPLEDSESALASLPILSNFELLEGEKKTTRRGLPLSEICNELYQRTGDWPKRVDKTLFVPGLDGKPRFLEKVPQLFSWLDAQLFIDWANGSDMITPDRLFAHLEETAERFDAVEQYPHWPPLPDTYYMLPTLPKSNGEYLREFVDFFSPQTATDRELLQAFVMSLPWGGTPGSRPAWLFTAAKDDSQGGRGVGKSKCIELCAELVGGMLEISPNEDIVAIKKRLLSPAARTIRLARIDNIKTYRFSWADLEGLITSPIISGHRMYKGEGRRPNTLTWALTLNGASLSKDMAKRVIVVELKRPNYSSNWEENVRQFIADYRWHILSDIQVLLES